MGAITHHHQQQQNNHTATTTRPKGISLLETSTSNGGDLMMKPSGPESTEFGMQPRWSLFLKPQALDMLYKNKGHTKQETSTTSPVQDEQHSSSKKMVTFDSFPTVSSVTSAHVPLTPAELKKRKKLLMEGSGLAHLQMARLHHHAQL